MKKVHWSWIDLKISKCSTRDLFLFDKNKAINSKQEVKTIMTII